MLDFRPSDRQRRLVDAILVLGATVLFFIAVSQIATALGYFSDILLAFFLAWLLAFIISPLVTRIVRRGDAAPAVGGERTADRPCRGRGTLTGRAPRMRPSRGGSSTGSAAMLKAPRAALKRARRNASPTSWEWTAWKMRRSS